MKVKLAFKGSGQEPRGRYLHEHVYVDTKNIERVSAADVARFHGAQGINTISVDDSRKDGLHSL